MTLFLKAALLIVYWFLLVLFALVPLLEAQERGCQSGEQDGEIVLDDCLEAFQPFSFQTPGGLKIIHNGHPVPWFLEADALYESVTPPIRRFTALTEVHVAQYLIFDPRRGKRCWTNIRWGAVMGQAPFGFFIHVLVDPREGRNGVLLGFSLAAGMSQYGSRVMPGGCLE